MFFLAFRAFADLMKFEDLPPQDTIAGVKGFKSAPSDDDTVDPSYLLVKGLTPEMNELSLS